MQVVRENTLSFVAGPVAPGETKQIAITIPFSSQSTEEVLVASRLEVTVDTAMYFRLVDIFVDETSILPRRLPQGSAIPTSLDVFRASFRRSAPGKSSSRKLWVVMFNQSNVTRRPRGSFHFMNETEAVSDEPPRTGGEQLPTPGESETRRGIFARVGAALMWAARTATRLGDEYEKFERELSVEQEESSDDLEEDLRVLMLGPMIVETGVTKTFSSSKRTALPLVDPDMRFRVSRLVIDEQVAQHFRVKELVTNGVSLVDFAEGRELPAGLFTPAEDTLLEGPWCRSLDEVFLTVRNVTTTSQLFWAKLVCIVEPNTKEK